MYALTAITLLAALTYAHAGGLGLVGSIDGGAVISGPSGIVTRTGLASVGPIGAPGVIAAGVAPGGILAGGGGLGLGLGLGLGGIANPGLAARALGLEGSGIEGQWVPDINEHLYDDGSYKPGLYGH